MVTSSASTADGISVVQQRVYQLRVHNVDQLKQYLVHVWHGIDQIINSSLPMQLTSGVAVFAIVCGLRVDTLNKCCDNIKRPIIQSGDNKRCICVNIIRFTKFISVILDKFEL